MKLLLIILIPFISFSQEEDATIYDFPDVEAQFAGGTAELMRFVTSNINHLDTIIDEPPSKIYFSFIVEKDGSISNFDVLQPTHPAYDVHYKQLFSQMPNWIPARVNGKAVRSRCRLPLIICYQ